MQVEFMPKAYTTLQETEMRPMRKNLGFAPGATGMVANNIVADSFQFVIVA
jgi:hypothetical protein